MSGRPHQSCDAWMPQRRYQHKHTVNVVVTINDSLKVRSLLQGLEQDFAAMSPPESSSVNAVIESRAGLHRCLAAVMTPRGSAPTSELARTPEDS